VRLLTVVGEPDARTPDAPSTVLFPNAFLLPSRAALAGWLAHVIARAVADRQRLRPSGQRGDLPCQPQGQRHRGRYRPAAQHLALGQGCAPIRATVRRPG
jgi:hypothetical protein